MSEILANVNGEILPLEEVRISPLDRGFLFGDAIYEVLRVYGGKPWLADEHFQRLAHSLEAIRLTNVDIDRFRNRMNETLQASGLSDAMIYIQITRGVASRTHAFPKECVPYELLWVQPFNDPYAEKRVKGTDAVTTPDIRWQRCNIKSTNLLGNVLAAQQAADANCYEALMYREDGTMTEGSHTNLFGVRDGAILTAPRTTAILPGITRTLIVNLAKEENIPLNENYLKKDELHSVSELFVSGTTAEVMPIVTVDGQSIGNGQPGEITKRLLTAYQRAVRKFVHS